MSENIIKVNLGKDSYDIVVKRGCLKEAEKFINLNRKVMIVTDSGVPKEYAEYIESVSKAPFKVVIEQGEQSKNFDNFKLILETMLNNNFTRTDCVVAVGGGVVGDLSGFVSACYMRGIDFYNIPTTVLSQVDSSVGGKTAVDFGQYKNMVGAFHQPKKVLIDPEVLKTLDKRQISNGLSESVKMAMTFDEKLFALIENEDIDINIDKIIKRSVELKRDVVEQDEKEAGLRKVLNFGHTMGHAIETSLGLNELYHGECVAIGMIPMCNENIKDRLIKVLNKLNLPVSIKVDKDKVKEAITHDKKFDGNNVTIIKVPEVGSFKMEKITKEELLSMLDEI